MNIGTSDDACVVNSVQLPASSTSVFDTSSCETMPTLSIIIPTFNAASTIIKCLQSVKMQVFTRYEVIIQDGNSKDETLQLVSSFRESNSPLDIRCYKESDRGVYDAMNKAIKRAKGSWLYFLGSDDELFSKDSLSEMLDAVYRKQAGVLYGNVLMVDMDSVNQDSFVYDGPFTLKKLLTKNICHQAIMYKRELVCEIGAFDLRYKIWADWDYNMRCWSRAKVEYCEVTVAKFYTGGLSSQGGGRDESFIVDAAEKAMSYFGLSALHPFLNTKSFIGWNALEEIQHGRSLGYRVLAFILRNSGRLQEGIRRKLF